MVTFRPGFSGLGVANPVGLRRVGVASARQFEDRAGDREAVSSGWPALDRLLPGGGVRRGSLIEWLAGDPERSSDCCCGAGAATLACAVAVRLAATDPTGRSAERGGLIVVVDRAGWFHPPAVLPWLGAGAVAARRLVVARPAHDDDEIWTIGQALRCAGVAAVVAWPRLAAAWTAGRGAATERRPAGHGGLQPWTTVMRRWQLAARSGGAVGLFVRSPAVLREPSWAESRLAVSAAPGGSLVERRLRIARVGGEWCGTEAGAGRPVEIAIDLVHGRPCANATVAARGRGAMRPEIAVLGRDASCHAS